MKNYFPLLALALLLGLAQPAQAQFQTPGTGLRWTLAQLAAAPGSNVTNPAPGTYHLNGDLRLSPTDTLSITTNATLRLASLAHINVDGVLLVNPPDSVKITAQTSTAPFHSFWFSATSNGSHLRKTIVEYGGGIKTVDCSLVLDSCVVRYQAASINGTSTNSGALNISGGIPRFSNCRIYDNARAGIASPANRNTSPVITNCIFRNNDTENANTPQINLGIGGATPILIKGCRITGSHNNAGGIAISNLLGSAGTTQAEIRGNYIANNRYGIAVTGSGIAVVITRNTIENNNTNPNALTGGSGINMQGGATLSGVVSRNVIRGNLWGVTMLRSSAANPGPTVSFGNVSSTDSLNVGLNRLSNNSNGGQVYDFYLNMADNILAQNNDWGTTSASVIESHVVHQVDQPALGLLSFQPFWVPTATAAKAAPALTLSCYPNPAGEVLTLQLPANAPAALSLRDALGRLVRSSTLVPVQGRATLPLAGLAPGLYLVEVKQQGQVATAKVEIGR
jgi:hypothetical protein